MRKKQSISERIIYTVDSDGIELRILGKIPQWQQTLIAVWMISWSLCGVFLTHYLFGNWPTNQKIFLLVYLAFWAYFEYKVVYAYLWRKYGFEYILVKNGELYLKNNILGRGKMTKYFVQNIKDFGKINSNSKSYSSVYFKSFWVIGGESIGFSHLGQRVVFGRQLEDQEMAKVVGVLKKYFKKK